MKKSIVSPINLLLALFFFTACSESNGSPNASSGSNENDNPEMQSGSSGSSRNRLIDFTAKANNVYFLNNGDGTAYLYVRVDTKEPQEEKKRVPLNISLVLDRSGSMSGEKIAYAKRAAKFVVEQLSKDDILSIVNYDDRVEVSSKSQYVNNKELLYKAIDKLFDRGSTNMSGGMQEGYRQVKSTLRSGYVNRILVLTDGLANVGLTEPEQLKRLVEKAYIIDGVATSTFGLGADYNEDLLTMLAESGRANYYYINQANKIPGIFARELKGLLSVVAQNAYVSVQLPEGVRCEKVYGYPAEVQHNKVTVRFNDLHANEQKIVVYKLRLSSSYVANYDFSCILKYTNAQNFNDESLKQVVRIKNTADVRLIGRNEDMEVGEALAMFRNTERFDEIMADMDKGNYKEAKAKTQKALEESKTENKKYNSPKLSRQEEQLGAYYNKIDDYQAMPAAEKSSMQKSSKQMNYEMKKNK